LGRSGGGAG
jgi:hypothetical protein